MDINIENTTPDGVAEMQKDYLATLLAPQDAYWQEGLIGASNHMTIHIDASLAGYLVLNSGNQLMQFHLMKPYHRNAPDLLKSILEQHDIKSAFAATMEPFYFSLCLDLQQKARVHTLLFSDHCKKEPMISTIQGHCFRKATEQDLEKVVPLFSGGDEFIDLETISTHFTNELGYARMVIDAGILHVLEKDGEILGTGEFRERESWPPFVDLGMIVNKKYRRRGVGSYILTLLKQKAHEKGLKPICSCEAGNVGSQKAVENAGFIAPHRVVLFTF